MQPLPVGKIDPPPQIYKGLKKPGPNRVKGHMQLFPSFEINSLKIVILFISDILHYTFAHQMFLAPIY